MFNRIGNGMSQPDQSYRIPSEDEVIGYAKTLSNWGRWGEDDWLGTLNLISDEKRREAARTVTEGVNVSMSRPFNYEPSAQNPFPPRHFMMATGESGGEKGLDTIIMDVHSAFVTHIDAPTHLFHEGTMYNGHSASLVTVDGAQDGGIELLGDGVVGRGVLLDIARTRGRDWLEAGEAVFPEDLEAAERAQNIQVQEGDILFVRTGECRRLATVGPPSAKAGDDSKNPPPGHSPGWPVRAWAGLHGACMPWLHNKGVAVLATDSANDVSPSGYANVPHHLPVHFLGLWAMGLWLVDGCDHEALTAACERFDRWTFHATIAPLKLVGVTGSPVNPIALF